MDRQPLSPEEIFEGVTNALPVLGLVLTPPGEIVDLIANSETRDFLSEEKDTLIGQSVFDVVPSETAAQFSTTIERALETGDVQTLEYQLSVQAGTKHFQGHVAPIPADEGTPSHVIWIAEDITEQAEYERQLRRYEEAVESASHAIYITDTDGRIEYANPAFEEITGYSPAEAIGHTPRILKSGEMSEKYYEDLWEQLLAGNIWEDVFINRRKSGELYHAEETITPIRNAEGDIEGFVAIQADITDRIELEEDRKRRRDHLARTESLAEVGGWEYDLATGTVHWTDGTRSIFDVDDGFSPSLEEAFEFFHPDDRSVLTKAFEECLEHGISYSTELQIITDTGRQRWVHTRGERLEEGGDTTVVGVIQDVTEQKMDQQRLMVLNRVLRHNLRNKLDAVTGYAELLEERYPENSRELFERIKASADALLSLAEKSRQSTRVLEYDYTSESVAVEELLADLCTESGERFPDATFETDLTAATVPGNRMGLRLIFEELVENALEHNDRDSPTVSVTMAMESEQRVAVTVADDGPGLPERERTVLESGEETSLIHSDGIGLWTINWLVTKFSGGTTVAPNTPNGTRITVTLPTLESG